MSDDITNPMERLVTKATILLKRFDEQKGIINAYIQKERDWKKNKLLQGNEILKLQKEIKNLNSRAVQNDW